MASASVADWRDGADYAWLLDADRSAFAWEWLRRDPSFVDGWRTDWARVDLLGAVDPMHDARTARPLWSWTVDASVLQGMAGGVGDHLDLSGLRDVASVVFGDGVEHWLLCDGFHRLRFDLLGGSLLAEPVVPRWMVDGVAGAGPAVLTLRRLMVVMRTGQFGGGLFAREVQAPRWILALRVCDALAVGAMQREIAEVLFGVSGTRWRVEAGAFRLRVQRLAAAARRHQAAGPGCWLS